MHSNPSSSNTGSSLMNGRVRSYGRAGYLENWPHGTSYGTYKSLINDTRSRQIVFVDTPSAAKQLRHDLSERARAKNEIPFFVSSERDPVLVGQTNYSLYKTVNGAVQELFGAESREMETAKERLEAILQENQHTLRFLYDQPVSPPSALRYVLNTLVDERLLRISLIGDQVPPLIEVDSLFFDEQTPLLQLCGLTPEEVGRTFPEVPESLWGDLAWQTGGSRDLIARMLMSMPLHTPNAEPWTKHQLHAAATQLIYQVPSYVTRSGERTTALIRNLSTELGYDLATYVMGRVDHLDSHAAIPASNRLLPLVAAGWLSPNPDGTCFGIRSWIHQAWARSTILYPLRQSGHLR